MIYLMDSTKLRGNQKVEWTLTWSGIMLVITTKILQQRDIATTKICSNKDIHKQRSMTEVSGGHSIDRKKT